MPKELLELMEAKKELRSKIERCQNSEELEGLKKEYEALQEKENLIIERARMAEALKNNPQWGNTIKAGGNGAEMYSSVEYRKAFMDYVLSGGKKEIPAEFRANAVTKTSDVGAVIPNTIIQRIIDKLDASGMVLREVTRTNLQGGVTYPVSTLKPVATWAAEGAGSDKQKKTVTGITFGYYKLRCAVAITLETSVTTLDIFEQTLVNNITEAMVIGFEKAIINGTGSAQPKGVLAETVPADRTITVAEKITYTNVVDAEAALPQAYEGNSKWYMSKKTFMGFIGQVDSNGQPIARVNYGLGGAPERYILGRPVVCNDYMESLSASTGNEKVVAFLFNMKNYALNTNYEMGIKTYEDNDTDDQVMKAIILADGKVIDNNGLVFLKTAAAAG